MASTNTATITRNSIWHIGYTIFQIAGATLISLAMARVIGPSKLGYFGYVMWLTSITGSLASLGLPSLLGKYMAEYIGSGEHGLARAVYFYAMKRHFALTLSITALCIAVAVGFGAPEHRFVTVIQVLALLPRMAVMIPSQANNAREDIRANCVACYWSDSVDIVTVSLCLWFNWGLAAIATAMLVAHTLEFLLKFIPVMRWVHTLPKAALPEDLRSRMLTFSGRATVLLLLNIVVWDRSDVIFLKMFNNSTAQLAFFTVTFGLIDKILLVPRGIAGMIGVTVFAQYGRGREQVLSMTATAARYALLLALPCFAGVAAIGAPLILLAYGPAYAPAVPVFIAAALLAVPKPLLAPAQGLLQAYERQDFLIVWSCICGALNVVLDLVLIPHYAALGAAIANGAAQAVACIGIWVYVLRHFRLEMDWRNIANIVLASLSIVAVAGACSHYLSSLAAVLVGIPASVVAFAVMLRVCGVLGATDIQRLSGVARALPAAPRRIYLRTLELVAARP